ncbi:SDR family NAD(P)-dependent oxidoreductase [Devosia lucknowensis]|nr:glucose 1-dehydrogenase [Devosia lucknowensis]
MFDDIAGKTALVTGASSGLGLHFAELLADHGAKVLLAARRADALDVACAAITAKGGSAEPVVLDVSDAQSVMTATSGRSIDILINNAGISIAKRAMDVGETDWDDVIDTNLKGSFLVAQAVARQMRDSGRPGAIVNIASILGLRVAGNLSVYAASKAASIQMTKALAVEWARHSIRVNALCPGYIETDLNRDFFATEDGQALIRRIPQRRLGQPDDLDGALLLLCSDAGRYITGAALAVDGGHLVSSL